MSGESKIILAIINNMKKKFQGKMIIDIFCMRFQEIIKEDGEGIFKKLNYGDDRFIDNSTGELSEILRIDLKWIKNNSSIIALVIETILMSNIISKEIKLLVWTNFNRSINFATNKRIKILFEPSIIITRRKSLELA
ncbi:hypothetical protein T552_00255 [Pneumocystis carinii B80]|uniref:Uncharacterized protein n=1 Tax=Pneumocystis carinii (strain B80) TaxID=1408658 RepID=A0A0W4ZTD2_PNEC8|nr:hypothetical protein T552_00255 [Pneumocystis carinii B80]KTW31617.1 hypothetical protein T552_00255 [Pneumocystis carinii B80]